VPQINSNPSETMSIKSLNSNSCHLHEQQSMMSSSSCASLMAEKKESSAFTCVQKESSLHGASQIQQQQQQQLNLSMSPSSSVLSRSSQSSPDSQRKDKGNDLKRRELTKAKKINSNKKLFKKNQEEDYSDSESNIDV
jgi:hypothetical protein